MRQIGLRTKLLQCDTSVAMLRSSSFCLTEFTPFSLSATTSGLTEGALLLAVGWDPRRAGEATRYAGRPNSRGRPDPIAPQKSKGRAYWLEAFQKRIVAGCGGYPLDEP